MVLISIGDVQSGGAIAAGADVTYFFNPYLGVGMKFNVTSCDVNFNDYFSGNDKMIFFAPALYSRFGKGRLSLGLNAGLGLLNWKWELSDKSVNVSDLSLENESTTGICGVLSVGVSYMVSQRLGFGFNVQSLIGSIKTDNYKRTPAPIGLFFEGNYRF